MSAIDKFQILDDPAAQTLTVLLANGDPMLKVPSKAERIRDAYPCRKGYVIEPSQVGPCSLLHSQTTGRLPVGPGPGHNLRDGLADRRPRRGDFPSTSRSGWSAERGG